jgi:hypothetical protein
MLHFAHYVKRSVSAAAQRFNATVQFAENQFDDQGIERPIFHSVPISSGAAARAKVGDTFWLFSQLDSPWGRLQPSLDARIVVQSVSLKRTGTSSRVVFAASDSSEWFPIFDAQALLTVLVSRNTLGETQPLLTEKASSVGQALRFPREIANAEVLVAHSDTVRSTPIDFISYRISDGTKAAFVLARCLSKSGRAVFWDRWSLPRRMSERGERLAEWSLDTHIQKKIISSRVTWGVQSPMYALDDSYSLLEAKLAKKHGKFVRYRPLEDV